MTTLSKRSLLQAFLGVGAVALAGAATAAVPVVLAGVDPVGADQIGRAWMGGRSGVTVRALTADLFPAGLDEAGLRAVAQRVRDDFSRGAMFVHRGWRLSETEARLCALIALS
jgi:hypothetical protein